MAKYCITITDDFTENMSTVFVQDTVDYKKVFKGVVRKEEAEDLYEALKRQYPDSYRAVTKTNFLGD